MVYEAGNSRYRIYLSQRPRMSARHAFFMLCAFLAAVSSAYTQQPATTSASSAPQTVLRSTTRLVQVSVIVLNRKGKAITNLKPQNFILTDEGKPERIAFFAAERPAQPHLSKPLPPNVFTNRFDIKGEDPGAVTIVLFDALNTAVEDQAYVRSHVLRILRTLRSQDRVAVYALTTQLLILHDFTSDASSLVSAVNRFHPKQTAAYDASNPDMLNVPALANDPGWRAFQDAFNNASGEISDAAITDRFRTTSAAIEAIADHVAGIPGRKNLIWVSGGIPNIIGIDRIGIPDRDTVSFEGTGYGSTSPAAAAKGPSAGAKPSPKSASTSTAAPIEGAGSLFRGFAGVAQALNRVNMAIYPVDAHGVEVDAQGFFGRQNRRDTFRMLADRTGGRAFYGTNDIAGALQAASDDARYSYTLGYYPDHGKWDGAFRKIKIQVNIPGAHLRYRSGYFALTDPLEDDAMAKAMLQQAAFSPLEATNLGMIVTGKALEPVSERKLILQINLDPRQFLLTDAEQHREGGLDLLFLQMDASGKYTAAERQHFGVNFAPKEYEMLSRKGLILQRTLAVAAQAAEIRIVVRDAGSGALGSVSFPVKRFLPPAETPAAPPAGVHH
jgi:VWFA-related protein